MSRRTFFGRQPRRANSRAKASRLAALGERLHLDQLEERRLLAGIITFGDSWGVGMRAPTQTMSNNNLGGLPVSGEAIGGRRAYQDADNPASVISRIEEHPNADIVLVCLGGNDFLTAVQQGQITIGGDNTAVYSIIQEDLDTVFDTILGVRPDLQIVLVGYDYPNAWDTGINGLLALSAVGIEPSPDPAVNLANNGLLNSEFRTVEAFQAALGASSRRVHYVSDTGLVATTVGYTGVLGTFPSLGPLGSPTGFPNQAYLDLPVPASHKPANDQIHLNTAGYTLVAQNSYNQFFSTAYQPAVLAAAPVEFGPTRLGTTAVLPLHAYNAGPNFTKLGNVNIPVVSGAFAGSAASQSWLFKDPTLGSDSVTSDVSYTPTDRVADSQNVTVTSAAGNAAAQLSGTGVGPIYSSFNSLSFTNVEMGVGASSPLDISNVTADGDLGSLTDLTLRSFTITGPDAAHFNVVGFTPGMEIDAGSLASLVIQVKSTAPAGARSATLTFSTDVGAGLGEAGSSYEIALSADVIAIAPTAEAGGPYTSIEGVAVALAGGGTGVITLYEWDFFDNGSYDALGKNLNWIIGNDGNYTVRLRVTGPGGSATDTATITIGNAPPTAGLTGSQAVRSGVSQAFALTATDPSVFDQVAGFTFDIDWDGNGSFDQQVTGASGTVVNHTFAAVGSYNVGVRATDKDAGASTVFTLPVHVYRLAQVGADIEWEGSDGDDTVEFQETDTGQVQVRTLKVGGIATSAIENFSGVTGRVLAKGHRGNDVLHAGTLTAIPATLEGGRHHDTITGGGADDILRGEFTGASGDGAEGSDSITGGAGHDLIEGDGAEGGNDTLRGGLGNDTLLGDGGDGAEGRADQLFGDDGDDRLFGHHGHDLLDGGNDHDILIGGDGAEANDTILGGAGNDILSGNDGADSLTGGTGLDLLIGGTGGDTLRGEAGEDLLLADRSNFDFNVAALLAIQSEWTSGDSYTNRILHLTGSAGGLNGGTFLQVGPTVLDDDAVDQLTGGSVDLDWFLYNLLEDALSDHEVGESQLNTA